MMRADAARQEAQGGHPGGGLGVDLDAGRGCDDDA